MFGLLTQALAAAPSAGAVTDAAAGPAALPSFLIQAGFIFVVFYFLLIRPNQKKFRQHQSLVNNLSKGDRVVTGGGIIGTITGVDTDTVQVKIAENTIVQVARSTIVSAISDTASVDEPKPAKGKNKKQVANDN